MLFHLQVLKREVGLVLKAILPEFPRTNCSSTICLMRLPIETLEEFKKIYEKEFGDKLSDKDAQEMVMRLLRLFQLLRYRPKPGLTDSKRIDSMNHES